MKRLAPIFAVLTLAACAGGPGDGPPRGERVFPLIAQPGDVVATEVAFALAAQESGQWTAFREFAAEDAVMFTPEKVVASDWLKNRPDPARAVTWQPHEVWMSCDGALAVSRGAWQRGSAAGHFITIWRRQEDGTYKWVFDDGAPLSEELPAPEFIATHVATCDPKPMAGAVDTATDGGASPDSTLRWRIVAPQGSGAHVLVLAWDGGESTPVLEWPVGAAD